MWRQNELVNISGIIISAVFFLALLFLPNFLCGQTYFITGKIYDRANNELLSGTEISLQMKSDTMQFYHTLSKPDGHFYLRVPNYGEYILETSFIGYKKHTETVKIAPYNTDSIFITIPLKASAFHIKEVEVVKARNAIKVKEDTIEYNAAAYTVHEDATVGDLLSKMPGIDVSSNEVTAFGEEVVKILVDGEEFFTGDPGIALNNLPAEIVDKIEVIDKKSDQAEFTGFDDGNREKTINIKTIGGRLNGHFGNFYAGTDLMPKHYNIGLNFNLFSGPRRISVLGSSNNINQQGFFSRDNMGLAGGTMNNDISTSYSAGTNYNDRWGKKWKINGNYFYSHITNIKEDSVSRIYFLSDTSNNNYYAGDNANRINQNHRINFRIENNINTSNRLIINPSVSVQRLESNNYETGLTLSDEDELINKMKAGSDGKSSGYEFSSSVLYMHRFNKDGRTFSLNMNGSANHTDQDKINTSNTEYYQTGITEIINQKSIADNNSRELGMNVSFTESLSSKTSLMISYEISRRNELSEQTTNSYDTLSQSYSVIDSSLSGSSDHHTNSHQISLGLRQNFKNSVYISATTSIKLVNLEGEQSYSEFAKTDKIFRSIESRIDLNYRKNNRNNFRFSYNGQAQLPYINDLFILIDNTNPLQITQGNTDLDPAYSHTIHANWRITNTDYTSFTLFNFEEKITQKYIGKYTITAKTDTVIDNNIELAEGSSYSLPVNCGNAKNISANFLYSVPFYYIKSNITFDFSVSYSQNPYFLNNKKYFSNNNNLCSSIKITNNASEWLDYEISYKAGYSIINNSVQTETNQNYYSGNLNMKIYIVPISRLNISSDLSMTNYYGIEMADDNNKILWNAAIAWKFLRHNYGELKLSVYDLLRSNTNISRRITNNYIEDIESTVLQQYFLITFSYKLKHFDV